MPSSNALARDLIELYFEEDQTLRTTVLVAESQPGGIRPVRTGVGRRRPGAGST